MSGYYMEPTEYVEGMISDLDQIDPDDRVDVDLIRSTLNEVLEVVSVGGWSSHFGISEMLNEAEKCKGLSWTHYIIYSKIKEIASEM